MRDIDSKDRVRQMRLRKGKDKKLIEEILPISSFLRCFERPGLDLYCEYFSGSQKFDAKIYCEGLLVQRQSLKAEYFLEVSIACHPKDYLKRECLEKGIPVFGGNKIERLKNGNIKSSPEASDRKGSIEEHFEFIRARIRQKIGKGYPPNTYLIVPLFPDTLLMADGWIEVINRLTAIENTSKFCGLFIYDTISHRMVLL